METIIPGTQPCFQENAPATWNIAFGIFMIVGAFVAYTPQVGDREVLEICKLVVGCSTLEDAFECWFESIRRDFSKYFECSHSFQFLEHKLG